MAKGKKRAEPDAPVKKAVGRPRKKKKSTPASDSEPPTLKFTLPSATARKKRQSGSSSASARPSASASASVPISDSEASSNVLVHLDSDSDILDDAPAPDIDAAAAAILGRNDDEEDSFADEAEKSQDSDEETEPQHEEEELDIAFRTEFVIPVTSSATDTITYPSDITFDDFMQKVADEMNIRRKELDIGYKLSTWTKDIMPRVITTPIHLIRLFNAVAEERTVRINARTPAKKPLQVTIVDLREKLSEKPASKKADSSDDEGEEARPVKTKTGPQYLRELEARHKCERHGGHCLVAKNGEHIPLGGPNLSLWSMLCAQGVHDSISTPPAIMGLPFETGSEAAPRSRATSSRQLPPPPAPYPYPYYLPPGPYPHVYQPQPAPPAVPAAIVNPPPNVPNADPDSDDDESPTLFPKIDDWLLELDTSDRGEDGHRFHQFGPALRNEGFARVVQILDLGAEGEKELVKICDGMPIGVAKLMMKYAKVDCKKIRKREAERKAAWCRE
ncbi:hypothetical protein GGX14DRAFT_407609 [Mycena pura]|uniref:Uncharacterized protein n=1 Tax=Mycena pura TaxID=153505 RepID=A0AAD6URR8_9AGAR|nr:hypothetical protein GGX14DRAFT_407609 [Mycena pura]